MDIWATIKEERASILETFETLDTAQWDVQSLCGHWTMRQLLGHLVVAADPPTGGFLVAFVRARGSFDKANDALAVAEAARPPAELLARYRARLGERNTPPGFGAEAPLADVLLHSLDVRIPLGLPWDRPADRYEPVLELLLSRRGARAFTPSGRPDLRWVATDRNWAKGVGDEVHGTMADLALAASGRGARIDAVSGPGHAALDEWLER